MEKILITKDGTKFFCKGADVHTRFGVIKKADIDAAKFGTTIKSHMGKEFQVISPSFIDKLWKIRRGPQIIPMKDVGAIIAQTGLQPNWKIVDAGTGSGALACHLGSLVPKGKVYTFDVREDHSAIAKENIEFFGLKNVIPKVLDIYKGIPHKNIDLVTLDLPEPWLGVEPAFNALKAGGYIVSYSPCIPQVGDFVNAVRKFSGLSHIKTIEIIEREWECEDRKIRPKTQQIGHSGFLSFVRKI